VGSNLTDLFGNVGVPELINFSYHYFVFLFQAIYRKFYIKFTSPILAQKERAPLT